ncbi:MAG: P-II family nitrogen regulator [Cyclobacteriaceae bacterium]|nr:P-II family nitrogen regulator [Cyclobacteriaceae bacterium]
MKFKMVLISVKPHLTDKVIDAAKEAGATGATIIPARGSGIHEAKSFFGLTLETQTDIIMQIVEEHIVEGLLEAVKKAGKFNEPGTGIAFVLPIEHVVGLESQMEKFKEKARDKYF